MHGYDVWCPWNPLPKFLNSCLMSQGFRPCGELVQYNHIGKVYWFNNFFFCPVTVIRDIVVHCYFIHNVLMLTGQIHCPVITNIIEYWLLRTCRSYYKKITIFCPRSIFIVTSRFLRLLNPHPLPHIFMNEYFSNMMSSYSKSAVTARGV